MRLSVFRGYMPDEIIKVNQWVELRRSGIHGQGIFARKKIPNGTRILEYVGERISKEESNRRGLAQEEKARDTGEGAVYIFDLNEDYDLDGNTPDNYAKYVNHSCDHNCEAYNEEDRIFLYSVQDLKKGQELTFDYGYDLEHFLDHPCRCGADKCIGYIVRKDLRPKLKKILRGRKKKTTKKKSARKKKAS